MNGLASETRPLPSAPPGRLSRALLPLVMVLVYVGYALGPGHEIQYIADIQIKQTIEHARFQGENYSGGFVTLDGPVETVYLSHYSLPYKVISAAVLPLDSSLSGYVYQAFEVALAALLGVTLWLYVQATRRAFGSVAALGAYVLLLFSYPLGIFAGGFYWFQFLHLLPFVFSFAAYPWFRRRSLRFLFLLIIAGLIFIKALCCYGYLTSIALSAVVPVIYYELRAGRSWMTALLHAGATFLAAIAGFAVAFWMHIDALESFLGSSERAWELIRFKFMRRIDGSVRHPAPPLVDDLRLLVEYLVLQGQWLVFAMIGLSLGALRALNRWTREQGMHVGRGAESSLWVLLLGLSLVAVLSWNVLMKGHMRHHPHWNFVTFYMPLNLIAYALPGVVFDQAVRLGSRNRWLQMRQQLDRWL